MNRDRVFHPLRVPTRHYHRDRDSGTRTRLEDDRVSCVEAFPRDGEAPQAVVLERVGPGHVEDEVG